MPDWPERVSRREFLGAGVASALCTVNLGARSAEPAADSDRPLDSARVVVGKRPGLLVHTSRPVQIESPTALLREGDVTPANALFVRNNLELDGAQTMAPLPTRGWKLELSGLVDRPLSVEVDELLRLMHSGRLQRVAVEMVLQCSGNGRAFFSNAAKVKGEPWTRGAMGNVRFAGVRLADVLDCLQPKVAKEAAFVTAEGRDAPREPTDIDFEHSLPLADVLERSILAFEMNDGPMPAVHGGPIRLVTPGYYGTMQIKWLSRLRFEAHETANHHHLGRYRTPRRPIAPGTSFTNTFDNSEPNWRLKTKCVILGPVDGERAKAGVTRVVGVAFGDGVRIETVLVSADRGTTWRKTALQQARGAYAWQRWSYELTLSSGRNELWARAIDDAGRSQPLEQAHGWNPSGYAYHSADRVTVTLR